MDRSAGFDVTATAKRLGMPPPVYPFFTTKEVGRGSGQGLPLVRGVVCEGHGGSITLDSTLGVGSTFTLRLPIDGKP